MASHWRTGQKHSLWDLPAGIPFASAFVVPYTSVETSSGRDLRFFFTHQLSQPTPPGVSPAAPFAPTEYSVAPCGGKVDPDPIDYPHLVNTALREFGEETGIAARAVPKVGLGSGIRAADAGPIWSHEGPNAIHGAFLDACDTRFAAPALATARDVVIGHIRTVLDGLAFAPSCSVGSGHACFRHATRHHPASVVSSRASFWSAFVNNQVMGAVFVVYVPPSVAQALDACQAAETANLTFPPASLRVSQVLPCFQKTAAMLHEPKLKAFVPLWVPLKSLCPKQLGRMTMPKLLGQLSLDARRCSGPKVTLSPKISFNTSAIVSMLKAIANGQNVPLSECLHFPLPQRLQKMKHY
jgi:8-oxo-dGTP pyrophosphatase MutT (NUDIX family)